MSQYTQFGWEGTTTNATPTVVLLDTSSGFALNYEENSAFVVTVIGHEVGNLTNRAAWEFRSIVFRDGLGGGTTNMDATVRKDVIGTAHGTWDASVAADMTEVAPVEITVTGEVGKTIHWGATGRFTSVV